MYLFVNCLSWLELILLILWWKTGYSLDRLLFYHRTNTNRGEKATHCKQATLNLKLFISYSDFYISFFLSPEERWVFIMWLSNFISICHTNHMLYIYSKASTHLHRYTQFRKYNWFCLHPGERAFEVKSMVELCGIKACSAFCVCLCVRERDTEGMVCMCSVTTREDKLVLRTTSPLWS